MSCTCPPGGVLREASCPQHGFIDDKALTARHAEEVVARYRKVRFGIPDAERLEMLQMLLAIHRVAMATFDAIEADEVSIHDIEVMAQLPVYCNKFTAAVEAHAQRRVR